jgi:HK97 family phage portal protein
VRWSRSLRPPDPVTPNANDPADVPPATVGPDQLVEPGDPHGLILEGEPAPGQGLPPVMPSGWSGWPADWSPPMWGSHRATLADIAWTCLDLNSAILSTMPPYLLGAAPTLDAAWLVNPDPDIYTSWEEFAKQLFWDYQLGEAFVVATAYYASGYPARCHVVPPWAVNVEMGEGRRHYSIGSVDVTADILHVRYTSTVDDAHGHGPLEAGRARLVAADVFSRYAQSFAAAGGIPTSILTHPGDLDADQSAKLKQQWVAARQSGLGEPAVLSGGITWQAVQTSPRDMALVELSQITESRIAVMLGVPPFLVGLPSGGDSMTYSNVTALFDYHWRAGL